jgi:FkbM family methyltransferase
MLVRIAKKLLSTSPTEMERLLMTAHKFPRHKKHDFQFKGMKFTVTDFLSVAYQLKEYFEDERMNFSSGSSSPVIYDCGANVGVSLIYFKKKFPSAKITAFEPDPEVYKCLQQNMKQNNIDEITLLEKAAWINNDGIEFGREGADGGSVFHDGEKIKVQTTRLKELLEKENYVDCLKMDIEGAETEVLEDCGNTLSRIKYLFVEYHSWSNQPQQLDRLLHLLSSNGFRYYIHSIGKMINQPFLNNGITDPMDIQLDIHAINTNLKAQSV